MAPDWNINVGFDTSKFGVGTPVGQSVGGNTGGGGSNIGDTIGKGFKAGLMATGIIGFIMNLKPILETISFLLGIIGTFLGFLIGQFVAWIIPFFKDPVRNMIGLAVTIVNGITTSLEYLLNAILGTLTFGKVGGFGENMINLPRLNEDAILAAYDNLKLIEDAFKAGKVDAEVLDQAQSDYTSAWKFIYENGEARAVETEDLFLGMFAIVDKATGGAINAIVKGMNLIKKQFDDLSIQTNNQNMFAGPSYTGSAKFRDSLIAGTQYSSSSREKTKIDFALGFK